MRSQRKLIESGLDSYDFEEKREKIPSHYKRIQRGVIVSQMPVSRSLRYYNKINNQMCMIRYSQLSAIHNSTVDFHTNNFYSAFQNLTSISP